MKTIRITALCALMFGVVAFDAKTQTRALDRETLKLDSFDSKGRHGGPVSTRRPLEADTWYVVQATGTFTLDEFGAKTKRGRSNFCGEPQSAPQRDSSGRPNGPAFVDAEFYFAFPREWVDRAKQCSSLPLHDGRLQMAARKRFKHVEPIGGSPTGTASKHRYSYMLKGRGRAARFRLFDVDPSDNSGVLRLVVRRARPDEVPAAIPAPTPAPPSAVPPAG